mmetsp:Transcript_17641/g.36535  ORF Transcript_17641/g.36535 Transcript_17641/m.36535 type:complete len:441 (-) Transcript_17641:1913-3235(-)
MVIVRTGGGSSSSAETVVGLVLRLLLRRLLVLHGLPNCTAVVRLRLLLLLRRPHGVRHDGSIVRLLLLLNVATVTVAAVKVVTSSTMVRGVMVVVMLSTAIIVLVVVASTSVAVVSAVNVFGLSGRSHHWSQGEVGESAANLGNDTTSTGGIADTTVALSIGSTSLSSHQMRTHGFHESNRLGVGRHREGPLDNVVAKWIHHELANAFRVTHFFHVHFLDSFGASLQAFLHYIRTELLNRQQVHLANDTFADRVDIFIGADIQDILDNIVSVSILHKFECLFHNTVHQVRACFTGRGIQATLNDTATVTMTSHITDTVRHGIKDKLGILGTQLEDDALNDMVSMTINAETCRRRSQGVHEDVRGGFSFRVLVQHSIVLVLRTEFHNLLDTARTVQVQTGIDQTSADALDQHDTFLRSYLFQNLLKQVIAKRIHHGFTPKG